MMKICKHCNSTYNPAEICCPKCGAIETVYPASKAKAPAEAAAKPAASVRVERKPSPQPAVRPEKKPDPKPMANVERKPASQPSSAPKFTGRLLKSFSMISLYEGEPTIGVAKATGDLLIYDDRIVFKKKLGNALGSAFGVIGMIAASRKARQLGDIVLRYDQIAQVNEGKYMGCMPTIVVTDRYGLRLSFAGMLSGASTREAVRAIESLIA